MEPYPEDSDRKQGLARTAEMGISLVPVVGSALQVAFNELAGRRLADRRTAWLNDLAQKVHSLEEQIGDFAKVTSEGAFMDALTAAAPIADRTSRREKLQALRNAVVNSLMPGAPDLDAQQLLFDLIDRFTPTHVRMLTLISDPVGWFVRNGIVRPRLFRAARAHVIEAGMPDLAGRQDLITRYATGLSVAGVIDQSVQTIMPAGGAWTPGTTALGVEFLEFIADPEDEIAPNLSSEEPVVRR